MYFLTKTNLIAATLLLLMASTLVASSWKNSAIFDETAHIAAAYSYVTQFDYRLNPEHPPLVKDLSALPLLFSKDISFPTDTKAWQKDINGQWDQGRIFLYESGNDADKILFRMRLPIMALAIALGVLLFWWTKTRFGNNAALIALALYSFSPTILAHSQFVTTDIGAALAFFASLASFVAFLENPSWKRASIAGVIFGLSQTAKFSLFLLTPFYMGAAIIWIIAAGDGMFDMLKRAASLIPKLAAIGFIGLAVIWLIYAPHIINYPVEKNLNDAKTIIGGFSAQSLVKLDYFLIQQPMLRPIGQYLFGLIMITQRAAGGNTQYFLGEISSSGSRLYFPLLYLLKEPIAEHLLSLLALLFGIKKIWSAWGTGFVSRTRYWIHEHPTEFIFGFFVIFYWTYSMMQPLNIGLRHVLPTFPLLFVLISRQITEWLKGKTIPNPQTWVDTLRGIFRAYIAPLPRIILIGVLLLWLALESINTFPHYLSYYNEFGGKTSEGYKIATDSNYDWGQDLIRLKEYADEHNIQKIAVDYFGGGNPEYYLGKKFEPWWSSRGPSHGYFAISANGQMGAYGIIGSGFSRTRQDSYEWLKPFRPVARAGTSIFIYKLP